MNDIFISWAREDITAVQRIVDALKRAGFSIWWDHQTFIGKSIPQRIKEHLDAASCVLVVWSNSACASDWVIAEAYAARAADKLLSVRIDSCSIPPPFNTDQTANLANWRGNTQDPEWKLIETQIRYYGSTKTTPTEVPPPAESLPELQDFPDAPILVPIKKGIFFMGASEYDEDQEFDEIPRHSVALNRDLLVCKYLITFDEWDAAVLTGGCAGYTPDDMRWGRGRLPVINASYDDARNYTRWLSEKSGHAYRLLTEAEWEYACRGGKSTRYPWGETWDATKANGIDRGPQRTTPVGTYPANAFGLHDMIGNVWEWCADGWHDNYEGAPPDGSEWRSESNLRVLRGGSWYYDPASLRTTVRGYTDRKSRTRDIGFRVVRLAE